MDVPYARAELALEAVLCHCGQDVHARAGSLDGGHVGVEVVNRVDDDVELRVAQVGVDLGGGSRSSGSQTEGADGPLQVGGAVGAPQRQGLADGGLVDLDDADAGGLEVRHLRAQGQTQLVGDLGARDVVAHEGPGHDRYRASEHALEGLVGQGLGIGRPGDRHRLGTSDVSPQDGGTGAARAVGLDPAVLGGDEAVEQLGEVLDHVVALSLAVNQDVQAEAFLKGDDAGDLGAHGGVVGGVVDLALAPGGAGLTDLSGLREGADGGGGQFGQAEALVLGRLALTVGGAGAVGVRDGADRGADLVAVHAGVGGALLAQVGVLGQLCGDGLTALLQALGQGDDLPDLLIGEGQPGADLRVDGGLALDVVGHVLQGGGGRHGDGGALGEALAQLLKHVHGSVQVGAPDVAS